MHYKKVFVFVFFAFTIFLIQSCKKGCPDRTALNYSASAKSNDGSCLYCDSLFTPFETLDLELEDMNPSSQYEFEDVLDVRVYVQQHQLNGNGCKLLGYNTNNNGGLCTNYYNNLVLVNLTPNRITFSGEIFVIYENSNELTYFFDSTRVLPFDSVKLGNIGVVCDPSTFPFIELNDNFNYTISYN